MSIFTIYTFGAIPFFIIFFVYAARKVTDIEVSDFIGMIFVSFFPFLREICAILVFQEIILKESKWLRIILFKKVDSKDS